VEATDILRNEHRAIETVLDALDRACNAVSEGRDVPAWVFSDGLDFIRNFADRCHHGKEEGRLFPLFAERGMPTQGGPIQVMLSEHEQGRAFVREAAAHYEKWAEGDPDAGPAMAAALQAYISLLRDHISKEDGILYPMGDRIISTDDDKLLVAQFDEVEEQEMGPGVHERYHAMIDRLADQAAKL
jgi:hemerythrin-like domain-containing protein